MNVVLGKRALVSAIISVLGFTVSQASIAANNIEINSGLPVDNVNISELSPGDFTSTDDGATLKDGSITSAWSNGDAVSITTTNSALNLQAGDITVNTVLDFNSYGSSSLSLNALDNININFDILDADANTADTLSLNLSPTGVVNLNASIGQSTSATINGALAIGDTGAYNLINATDSLTVDSITKTALGTFNYVAGSLTINSLLNIDTSGVIGSAFILDAAQNLHTASQSVGTVDALSGNFTQNAGSNTIDGALTVAAGGNYALNNGTLAVNNIDVDGDFEQTGGTNTVSNIVNISDTGNYVLSAGSLTAGDVTRTTLGVFTYTGGDLTLSSGTLAVEANGLLGDTVTIGAAQNLHTANQTVGTGAITSGLFTQDGGTNAVDGALTINTGGSYFLNSGTLVANSIANDGSMAVVGTFTINDGNSYAQSGNLTANSISAYGSLTQNSGNTVVTNATNIGSTGNYSLSGGSMQSGSSSIDGTFSQTAGSNVIANGLSVNTTGVYNLNAGTLTSGSLITDGVFTQTAGNNTVNGALNIQSNGTYNMNGGNLEAVNVVNAGVFNYSNGGVLLTGGALNIDSASLLGNAITIDTAEIFGATSMTVGDGLADGGTVIQNDGSNAVTNALTVNNNGSYTLNSGSLQVGSLLVKDGGIFAGVGAVTASGDITDQRTSGVIDVSYSGANISLAADTMNGAINANKSIALDSITVNGVVTGTAMTLSGGSVLANDVNLKPYVLNNFYNRSVITSSSGNNTISGNVSIAPLLVNRFLSVETVDAASIDVDAGSLVITGNIDAPLMDMALNVASTSSLSLQGSSTSTKNLDANAASGATLLLGNTTATRFNANGVGSFEVNGALTTSGIGSLGNVTIQGGNILVNGANGSIAADGSTIVVGTNTSSVNSGALNTAQLLIDNSAIANSNRIGDGTNIQLSTGSILTFNGHASDSTAEKAGSLIIEHLKQSYASSRDFVSNVVVNGGTGTTQLTFDGLQIVAPVGGEINRIDFATNGSFGGNEKILFNAAPMLVSGLLQNATINGEEFVTYNNSLGIKSATTATNNFVATGNVLINSNTNLSANTTINSLAVTTANVNGVGNVSLTSGYMLLSGTSIIDPSINFGATEGNALVTGDSTLNGGVNGSNGLFVNGGGTLTLAGAGIVTGAVTVNSGNLVLSSNNALQGADITVYDNLNIGATTQNVKSLTTGSGFSGTGSVIATNNILYSSNAGIVDANYQSLDGNVTVYANVMNGDINALYGYDTILDPSKGVVTLGNSGYSSTTMNGNAMASRINVYGTVNGNLQASNLVYLRGTANGIISGTGDLSGSGTLTAANTYTGSTSGYYTLRGNGSIANSSNYTGSLNMYSNDGELNLNRIGDSAQINLTTTLNLVGSGSDVAGVVITEDVGVIDVAAGREVNINIGNSLNGSTTLTADSLTLGNDALVFLSLGNASQLKFDAAPTTIGSTGIIGGVYAEKDINGLLMPTWTTYDGINGVVEVAVAESSIASASTGDFIRVTDAVNTALTVNETIGAMTVDTTQTMSGAYELTVSSGQIQFWQDNAIDIAQINLGLEQAFLSNAGTNTVSSVLTGSNGLRKLGEGKIILAGANTYTGQTLISTGELDVSGSVAGDVLVSSGASLTISNGGQVNAISSNDGTVNLINASHSVLAGQTVSDYGAFNIDAFSNLSNAGTMNQYVTNNGGAILNSAGSSIYRVYNEAGSNLTNYGNITRVYNRSGATFTNNAGEIGNLTNDGTYIGSSVSVIGSVQNNSSFTNNGIVNNSISNGGSFINNGVTLLNGFDTYNTSADRLTNNIGTFTNNALLTVAQEGLLNIVTGTFENNDGLVFQNATNSQIISGTFINNSAGVVDVNGSTVNLDGTFVNKGSVNIDATSLVTGAGTYRQQGNNAATTVVNGRVETSVEINNGVLSGTGIIAGDLVVSAPGILRPGNSPGLMTIEGNLDLSGLLDLEVVFDTASGLLVYDSLAIGGDFNIFGNGRINLDLGIGVNESIFTGTTPVLSLTDIFYGTNEVSNPLDLTSLLDTTLNLNLASGESFKLSLIQDESGAFSTSVSAVPVPAAVWLFASGLLGLLAVARRRA